MSESRDSNQDLKLARLFVRTLGSLAKLGPEAVMTTLIHGGVHVGAHILGALVSTGILLSPKVPRGGAREK